MISYSQFSLVQNYSPPPKKIEVSKLKVIPEKNAYWEANREKRDQILTKMWLANARVPEIQRELNYQTPNGVYAAVYRLNLPKRKLPNIKHKLVANSDQIIIQCWPNKKIPLCDIARKIGSDWSQYVSKRAKELGLPNRRNGQARN